MLIIDAIHALTHPTYALQVCTARSSLYFRYMKQRFVLSNYRFHIQGVQKRYRYRKISHGGWGGVRKCQKNSPGGRRRFSWELRGVKGVGVSPCKYGNRIAHMGICSARRTSPPASRLHTLHARHTISLPPTGEP